VAILEHCGVNRRVVRVLGEKIPSRELEAVQGRQRDEILDHGGAIVGAFTETDRAELCERANRLCQAPSREQTARDERGGHGSQAGEENGELAFWCFELNGSFHAAAVVSR